MADQFCRIVDTTLTDDTLGSDAAQTVITTDANTSYVVRDVNLTSSCTADVFKMELSVEMDGHSLVSCLDSSVEGSLIVPPSSTVCVKDTSGNYPLTYGCTELSFISPLCGECCNNFRFDAFCTVNSVQSGPTSSLFSCSTCYCCNIYTGCTFSMFEYYPDLCRSIFINFDSSNNHANLFWNRHDCQCTCCCDDLGNYCYSGGLNLNSGIFVSHGTCCIQYRDFYCGCHNGGEGGCFVTKTRAPQAAARIAVSAPHPCYSDRLCRATATFEGVGICCLTSMDAHNFNCTGSSENLISGVTCVLENSCSLLGGTDSFLGVYWSREDNNWVYFTGKDNCCIMNFVSADGSTVRACMSTDIRPLCGLPTASAYDLYVARNNICCVVKVDLDDLRANGSSAKVTYLAPSGGPNNNCYTAGYSRVFSISEAFPSALSCDFDIQPSAKLSMYGIKST